MDYRKKNECTKDRKSPVSGSREKGGKRELSREELWHALDRMPEGFMDSRGRAPMTLRIRANTRKMGGVETL